MRRLIVGLTGATGAIFGVRLLEELRYSSDIETHLVISNWARRTIEHETRYTLKQVRELATVCHNSNNMAAEISSGSFITEGMVIIPCSVRTLGSIAHGDGEHLVHRAADVVLKERRRLVLVVRESPLSELHLENMLKLARMGVSIVPPMPAFYNHPKSLNDMVDHIVGRVLDQFGIPAPHVKRWDGRMKTPNQVGSEATNTGFESVYPPRVQGTRKKIRPGKR
jgi:4-hydroxy-3-polyprenylbenzoate decarboxylase